MKFDLKDVDFKRFRGSGPGGQHKNKTETCVRVTHRPTGVVAVATSERSLHQNMMSAVEMLKGKLARMAEERLAGIRRQRHDAKPDAAFGHAIRTVRMCGNVQGCTDHRTGIFLPLGEFMRGRIDPMIEALLRSER